MLYPWLLPLMTELSQRLQDKQLHHGILLVGEHGSGESVLAQTLVKRILCSATQTLPCNSCKACMLLNAQSHPDFHPVTTEKTQIGVDAVRVAIEQVTKTAQLSANKVVLIENIETMSESASNALLKTLEEPTNDTYLVLSTNAPQYLLATIKSRCEKIRVPMPSYQQSIDFLAGKTQTVPTPEALAAYKHSPLLFLEQADNTSLDFVVFQQDFISLTDGKASAESLANKWKDFATEAVHWTAQLSLQLFATEVKNTTEQSHRVVGVKWMAVYDSATLATKKLRQAGLNKALILSALFAQVQSTS
ncbi:AAA family ATPase [Glaciecola sp. SC05]|uniref:AAA family ATPase n=1 Tax=Glaciecola sp. SC05 TaxID=1987355 RepID=UPI003529A2A2